MTVVVKCKRCGKELRAKDRYAGMPTRCPRCETINQLPSLSPAVPPKKAAPSQKPRRRATPPAEEASSDICKVCGKPIRGKAERFTDVHGAVYHLACYQEQAGGAPENACRICYKSFQTAKERVKDVVGFYYHRKCYQEELERQKQAAAGVRPDADAKTPSKTPAKPKPDPKPAPEDDDWNLTPDEDDDWGLEGEVDDGWMRPDPEELEVKEEADASPAAKPTAKSPANLPSKSAMKPAGNPLARKGQPKEPAPEAAAPAEGTSKASPSPPEETPGGSKTPPPTSSGTTAKKTTDPKKAKPLPRAKPIEDHPAPAAALPEGLELLPDKPKGLPDGLELLPESPQDEVVEGLELLDDASPIPVASVPVAAAQPVASAGLSFPDNADPFGGLQPLDDVQPLGVPSQPTQGDPFAAPIASDPLQGDAFGSPVGRPLAIGPGRHSTDNSIPGWLWALMGLAVGIVVIMLLSSVVNVMWTSWSNERSVANADSSEDIREPGETDPSEDEEFSDADPFQPEEAHPLGGDGFLPDNRPPKRDWPPHDVGPPRESLDEQPESDVPPDSRLAKYREFREKMKNAGGPEWAGFVVGISIFLVVYLAISALALRFSCSIWGKSGTSGGAMMGICVSQAIAMFVLSPLTIALDSMTATLIETPLACAVSIALCRFMLPTSTGRAVGIGICHTVMTIVFAIVLVIVVVFGLIILAVSMRGAA